MQLLKEDKEKIPWLISKLKEIAAADIFQNDLNLPQGTAEGIFLNTKRR